MGTCQTKTPPWQSLMTDLGLSRELTKLEQEIVHDMAGGHRMTSTSFHVFVRDRRTNRLLLSRLRDLGIIETETGTEYNEQGIQHWVLSEKGRAWAKENM